MKQNLGLKKKSDEKNGSGIPGKAPKFGAEMIFRGKVGGLYRSRGKSAGNVMWGGCFSSV